MRKVLRIGTIEVGRGRGSIFCKAEIEDGKLSISGVIAPYKGGNAGGGCGQIDMEFEHRDPKDNDKRYSEPVKADDIKFAQGWTKDLWFDFLDIWKKWHLNDMKAGTPKQEEALKDCPFTDYTERCGWLRGLGLYDDNGYKYGTAWLKVELPKEVIDFINALPSADREPAWV